MSTGDRWWADVLRGGLSPLRYKGGDGDHIQVEAREHGEIDVVSGRTSPW
jgi:hypothetical protein